MMREDLAHLVRLALLEQSDDIRLFVARLVRKYRGVDTDLAEQFDNLLKSRHSRSSGPLRKTERSTPFVSSQTLPTDEESRLSLLKFHENSTQDPPLLSGRVRDALRQLVRERHGFEELHRIGLIPTRSAIFIGKPGVGKTLTARWLADQLGLPLFVLDLTAVMSSFLGKTGSNLRSAIDFAKQKPCVLLLDEIDAIAKRRNDETDVGELKRLVTVMLQEVEDWPATGLLLAATNHPELIDPALWRRFDLLVTFEMPGIESIKEAIVRFFGPDYSRFHKWRDILATAFCGESFSDIERAIHRFRRTLALKMASELEIVEDFVSSRVFVLERQGRIDLALLLAKETNLSQHRISDVTGVSRDTIRKYAAEKNGRKGRSEI